MPDQTENDKDRYDASLMRQKISTFSDTELRTLFKAIGLKNKPGALPLYGVSLSKWIGEILKEFDERKKRRMK